MFASSVEFQLDPNQEGFPTAGRPTALVPPLLSAFVGFATASLIMVPAVLWTKARHQKCQRERETYGHLYAQGTYERILAEIHVNVNKPSNYTILAGIVFGRNPYLIRKCQKVFSELLRLFGARAFPCPQQSGCCSTNWQHSQGKGLGLWVYQYQGFEDVSFG